MSPEPLSFTTYQATFAARIRDPRGAPRPPGAPARRMRVYEELLFNNLEGFLLACYPVTRKILGAQAWKRTVRHFFKEHRCHSPLFRDIPKAFLEWIKPRAAELFPNLPFLHEFMHYEWLELAVETAPDEIGLTAPERVDAKGDLLAGRPVVNPTARLACYHYPVHRIGPRYKPAVPDEAPHCYLLFRDSGDEVRFIQLNPLAAHLMDLLRGQQPTGREALAHLAGENAPDQFELYLHAGGELLNDLYARGALLGTWREP
ncbi:MAG: putative DNA-binding domain-containing protein [Thiobacillus sp.]|nr:putative DNA-binding domain-containing protein [Thiobacillus sp.]